MQMPSENTKSQVFYVNWFSRNILEVSSLLQGFTIFTKHKIIDRKWALLKGFIQLSLLPNRFPEGTQPSCGLRAGLKLLRIEGSYRNQIIDPSF